MSLWLWRCSSRQEQASSSSAVDTLGVLHLRGGWTAVVRVMGILMSRHKMNSDAFLARLTASKPPNVGRSLYLVNLKFLSS